MPSSRKLAFELQNVIGQLGRANILRHDHSKLKGAEKHILFLISGLKNGEPVTISEIANKIGVTLAAVTHQINPLEKQGLIRRLSDKDDHRIVLIGLTQKGSAQVLKLKKEFAEKIQILAEFLGERDTKNFIHLVNKISTFQGFTRQ